MYLVLCCHHQNDSALIRWAVVQADLTFTNCEWQSHKTAQTTTFEEYGELMWT